MKLAMFSSAVFGWSLCAAMLAAFDGDAVATSVMIAVAFFSLCVAVANARQAA